MVRKGQSAMEYLMTYGWAILIIVVVLAALFYMGVFTPAPGESCKFPSGALSCKSLNVWRGAANVQAAMSIANLGGQRITITGARCTQSTSPGAPEDFGLGSTNEVVIEAGADGLIPVTAFALSCRDTNDAVIPITSSSARAGSPFRTKIYVLYTDESGFTRTAVADIVTRISA
ncbi:MAG: hypothetical protein AB1468_04845 [Candidatus Micrarchaeota archaeon]